MRRVVVLVMLGPDDPDAGAFRNVISVDPVLKEQVELRFHDSRSASEEIRDAEVMVCGGLSADLLAEGRDLRWISFWSAGMDNKATPELLERRLTLTSANGVHGPNIAEHVLMFMLMFTRGMPFYIQAQREGRWDRNPHFPWSDGAGELDGQTLGIVGLGRIGEALTVRAKACAMRVVAMKRNPQARYDDEVRPDALYGPEDLPQLLGEADHVCIALPYTPQTHHLFDAPMLAHMRPGAYLYNIARGKIVDEAALAAALRSGALAGAGLDVFETEPLPSDSPLWTMENVLITPHVSGMTPHYFLRTAQLFAANLKRYLADQPLVNRYDPTRGY